MAKQKNNSKAESFESSLEHLKSIVADLENGNLSLDQSLEKYELGVKHLKNCYQALQSAQRKIEILVELDDDGKLKTQPFEDQATEFSQSGSEKIVDNKDIKDTNVLF